MRFYSTYILIPLLLTSLNSLGKLINEREMEELLISSIFEELLENTKDLTPPKNLETKVDSPNQGSRGKLLIEEMKRKNREKLAKLRGVNPNAVESGSDLVKQQKLQNKELITEINKKIRNIDEWQNLAKEEIQKLKNQIISDWKIKHAQKIKAWDAENKIFKKNQKKYKNTTFDLPLVLNDVDLIKEKERPVVAIDKEFTLAKMSLAIPVRDQKYRPTCGSFAGIRAIETKLYQANKFWDLSEQYFYWASKDDCRFQKCNRKGSWVGYGLDFSKNNSSFDIPLEADCAYQDLSRPGNETQIPLSKGCHNGKVQVSDYKYFHSTDEIINQINDGNVVVASVVLTPNFYSARSLMLYKNRLLGKEMDSHASGHALTIIGHVKLPSLLEEGRVCFIVANSWGEGWGKGGHSCISELWIQRQKQSNPFVTVTSVRY